MTLYGDTPPQRPEQSLREFLWAAWAQWRTDNRLILASALFWFAVLTALIYLAHIIGRR